MKYEELISKWWYRLLKVIYIIAYVWTVFSVLWLVWNVSPHEGGSWNYVVIVFSVGLVITYSVFEVIKGIFFYVVTGEWRAFDTSFIKKHKRLLIFIFIFIYFVLFVLAGRGWYLNRQKNKLIKAQEEKFHNSEVAYQKCLDKIASLTTWENKTEYFLNSPIKFTKEVNKYWDEWNDVGRPHDNYKGYYEVAFIQWMMEKYPEFCKEYDINLINYFLKEKANNPKNQI